MKKIDPFMPGISDEPYDIAEHNKKLERTFTPGKVYELAPMQHNGIPRKHLNERSILIYQGWQSGKHIFKFPGTNCITARTNAQLIGMHIQELNA